MAEKILAVIQTELYQKSNRAIESYLSNFEEIHVVADVPGVAEKISARVGCNAKAVPLFDIKTYDRDHYYTISAKFFERFERYCDAYSRSKTGRYLDINTEKFRVDYLDFLSSLIAESYSFANVILGTPWAEVILIVDADSDDFHEYLDLSSQLRTKITYYSASSEGVAKLRLLRPLIFQRSRSLDLEYRRKKLIRNQKIANYCQSVRSALSNLVFVIGKKSFRIKTAKDLVIVRNDNLVSLGDHDDIGIFAHVSELTKNTVNNDKCTMLIAEVQSRPYAEALGIALQYIPESVKLILIAPTQGAAQSEYFAKSIIESAVRRLGPKGVEDVIKGFRRSKDKQDFNHEKSSEQESYVNTLVDLPQEFKPLYSDEAIAIVRSAFSNISFYYVDLRGIDSSFVSQTWLANNRSAEKTMIVDAINHQFNELPFKPSRLRADFDRAAQAILLHTYQADLFAKELFNHLDTKVETLVSYSGRHWLTRIVAVEARRRAIKVVDWQCTILGKTPVFPKIIADRVLAIFKNAAELYNSFFGFNKSQIDVVGFPRFMRRMTANNHLEAEKLLRQHNIEANGNLHIFASQPFNVEMQEKLLSELAKAAEEADALILVCAHPSQRVNGQDEHLKLFIGNLASKKLVFSTDFEATDLFVLAKSVIAYSSTFVFEVAHFGWPAIIFDPLEEPHILDYDQSTEIMSATNAGDLAACLRVAQNNYSTSSQGIDFNVEEQRCAGLIWDGITRPI